MTLKFTKALLPKDKRALVRFDRTVFPKADWFPAEYWDQIESYWMILDGERIGCCAFERHADFGDRNSGVQTRRDSLYIVSTGILPDYQGNGLGDIFKRWQIAWARRHGFLRIVTNSRRSNQRMIRLNRKHGFRIVHTTPSSYYRQPAEPSVVMELRWTHPSRRSPAGIRNASGNVILSASMQTDHIVALLVAERNRLDAAIEALQGSVKRRGPARAKKASAPASTAPKAPVARKRKISEAGRKAMVEAAKKRWAAIRAGKAPNPFAKGKSKKTAKG